MNDRTRKIVVFSVLFAGSILLAGYGALIDDYLTKKKPSTPSTFELAQAAASEVI